MSRASLSIRSASEAFQGYEDRRPCEPLALARRREDHVQEESLVETGMRFDCSEVDWNIVSETLERVGMAYYEPDVHKRAFENSQVTVFFYHSDHLIGFGRAISDHAYQAAIYDVAVVPEFQGQDIGTSIVRYILDRLPQCNFILYASPGKEDFYRKLGWRKMKTGMAFFKDAEEKAKKRIHEMRSGGWPAIGRAATGDYAGLFQNRLEVVHLLD